MSVRLFLMSIRHMLIYIVYASRIVTNEGQNGSPKSGRMCKEEFSKHTSGRIEQEKSHRRLSPLVGLCMSGGTPFLVLSNKINMPADRIFVGFLVLKHILRFTGCRLIVFLCPVFPRRIPLCAI